MALERYNEKRDFAVTPEPRGRAARKGTGNGYLIQKHAARRLHYDLRLELDGVLLSWAVTKGPSLVAGERRLAVHVEDHPLDYGDFEGTIPKGEYGGGTVMLWDRGTWSAVGDARKGYAKGHLEFELQGEKLQGRWHLVRMQRREKERENWLLIKAEDDVARPADAPDILDDRPLSVKSGRDIDQIAEGDDEGAELPGFLPPMLATLAPAAPTGTDWLHEIKFDGYRLQARVERGAVTLLTRSGHDWTERFGTDLPRALAALPLRTALIDAELVVEAANGASDFSALQADLSEGRSDRFTLYAFDLMHLDGRDLTALPLWQRKDRLEALLAEAQAPLRYSVHYEDSGGMVLRHACRLGLEGVVSKQREGAYRPGRGKGWIKSKCSAGQEFVIGGYVVSSVDPKAVGSLVLGAHDAKGALQPVGRVGTGFTARLAGDLWRRLDGIAQDASPFARKLSAEEGRHVRFVRPELVAEVEFRAWTAEGHLRHASFRGLREDKPAAEVRHESGPARDTGDKAARPNVRLTHPERVYWPDAGITKEGLADYCAEVWPRIAPFVLNRPLALLRCPEGIDGPKFFQKHAWRGIARQILQVPDPTDPAEPLLAIDGLAGLVALVQSAALEWHPWGSSLSDWERPDMIIMDLDPAEDVAWSRVLEAATELRMRLKAAGLASFVKTSGGKGLHVVAPLKPHATWPEVKAFTRAMAQSMAKDAPQDYVATITKAKRKGKILIDYLRNQRQATAVAAWSTRARPGAPVSTPLDWSELGPDIGPAHFTLANIGARLSAPDPWEDFRRAEAVLRS